MQLYAEPLVPTEEHALPLLPVPALQVGLVPPAKKVSPITNCTTCIAPSVVNIKASLTVSAC